MRIWITLVSLVGVVTFAVPQSFSPALPLVLKITKDGSSSKLDVIGNGKTNVLERATEVVGGPWIAVWTNVPTELNPSASGSFSDDEMKSANAVFYRVREYAIPNVGEPGEPFLTGNTATDAFNWLNFRRRQAGLSTLVRNASIDMAAQGHSDYQRMNDVSTDIQEPGKPGFTGVSEENRLFAAGYFLPSAGYLIAEAISDRSSNQGAAAMEELIGAIYRRYGLLQPVFKEAGVGSATSAGGTTYLTINCAAIGLNGGLPPGKVAVYPFAGQSSVPTSVNSDNVEPDPVPNQTLVGYPVSVHANSTSRIIVQSFTIKPRGGSLMATHLLDYDRDYNTPSSAAAIMALSALAPATTYDAQFAGTVDGIPVSLSWSFTTEY